MKVLSTFWLFLIFYSSLCWATTDACFGLSGPRLTQCSSCVAVEGIYSRSNSSLFVCKCADGKLSLLGPNDTLSTDFTCWRSVAGDNSNRGAQQGSESLQAACKNNGGRMVGTSCQCPSGETLIWKNGEFDDSCLHIDILAKQCKKIENLEGYDDAVHCIDNFESAKTDCSSENGEVMGKSGTLSNAIGMAGKMTAMSGSAACSQMGKTIETANAGLTAFKANCGRAIAECEQTCSRAKTVFAQSVSRAKAECKSKGFPENTVDAIYESADQLVSESASNITQCKGKENMLSQADQGMKSLAASMVQSQNCASQFSAQIENICDKYPDIAGCKNRNIDCTKAENASTQECICSKNARDPKCKMYGSNLPSNPFGPQGRSGSGSFSEGANAGLKNGEVGPGGSGLYGESGEPMSGPGGNGVKGGSSQSGSGAGLSGSGGGAAGGPGGGYGEDEFESPSTGSGFNRGGSGGIYGSGSSAGSGDERYAGGGGGKDGRIDLRKYLPGGELDAKRKIAGAVGPDGITCSTCGTLFQKITTRFQILSSRKDLYEGN